MVDIGHGINSIVICIEEAASKITRSMSSSLKYLQSKQATERNSTSEQEALSEMPEEDAMKHLAYQDSREANFPWELREEPVAVSVPYSSGGSPPGVLWSDNDGAHLAVGRVLWVTYLRHYRAFSYCTIATFLASMATVLASIFIVSSLQWWLWTLGMFCIMGAFGAARSCCTLAISAFFARDGGKKVAAETLEGVHRRLVMFAALVVVVTYQAGLTTSDTFLSVSQADDEHLPVGRDSKLRGRHLERLVVAFLCSNIMVSLIVLKLLMRRSATCHGHGFCSWALRVCTGVALIRFTDAFAIWSSTSVTTYICFSALVVTILLCNGLQVLAFLHKTLANLVSDPEETIDADELLQTSLLDLHLLAILFAASITYGGLTMPVGIWQENATDGLHHYRARGGDPIIPHTTYPRTYQAFFYCNATVFVAWLVLLMLPLTKICRTRGIMYCALQVAMTLDLLWLIGAYVAGNCSGSDPAVDKDDPNSPIKRTLREATWRVACATPHHMTGNRSLLLTGGYLPLRDGNDGEVVMVHPGTNGEAVPLRVHGSGSVRTESIALDDVWYVPGLDSNLVSTGQLARQGCAINLGPHGCRITRGDALVGTARFTEACQFELDFLKVAASSM